MVFLTHLSSYDPAVNYDTPPPPFGIDIHTDIPNGDAAQTPPHLEPTLLDASVNPTPRMVSEVEVENHMYV